LVIAEAIEAGITRIVLVSGRGKSGLMDHFDRHPQLEALLRASGKDNAADAIVRRAGQAEMIEVRQGEAKGLGHAVLCGAAAADGDRVAVMLPDDLYIGSPAALSELIALSDANPKAGVIGLLRVPPEDSSKYGMVSGETRDGHTVIDRLVEKPAVAPSDLAITGRYVLPTRVFELLANQGAGALGEIQLTDALQGLADGDGMLGIVPSAPRYDAGNHEGLLLASLRRGLDAGGEGLRQKLRAELER